jgi:hypothetical protein
MKVMIAYTDTVGHRRVDVEINWEILGMKSQWAIINKSGTVIGLSQEVFIDISTGDYYKDKEFTNCFKQSDIVYEYKSISLKETEYIFNWPDLIAKRPIRDLSL